MAAPLVIITGAPGAGKTTAAELWVTAQSPSVHVYGDVFYDFLRNGRIAPWTDEAAAQNAVVAAASVRAASAYAIAGWATALDGIFGPWQMDHVASQVAADIDLHYVILTAQLDTVLARTAGGDGPLTPEIITGMHGQFADAGEWSGHVIDTTTMTPEDCQATLTERLDAGDFLVNRS